jgi:DNA-binding transcriptional regulator YbjK
MEENDQKKKKGEKTKRKLFEAAARLFERYRFDNVTVDSIVEEAGWQKARFILYFDSKDGLSQSFYPIMWKASTGIIRRISILCLPGQRPPILCCR